MELKWSESRVEIAKALSTVQGELGGIGKSGENTFDKYKYATLIDYTEVVKPALAKHGLSLITGWEMVYSTEDPEAKKRWATIKMDWTLLHTSGEYVSGEAMAESCDKGMGDKCVFKGLTGCKKYLLASLFNLATTDDPEKTEFNKPDLTVDREPGEEHPVHVSRGEPEQILPYYNWELFKVYLGDLCKVNGWKKAVLAKMIGNRFPQYPKTDKMSHDERRQVYFALENGMKPQEPEQG